MTAYFGQDFSQVRVHTASNDAQSAQAAKALNARAYTAGNHIVFAPGQYAPQTPQGQYLLAHELSHVVQQQTGLSPAPESLGTAGDRSEREAEQAAKAIALGGSVTPTFAPATAAVQQRDDSPVPDLPMAPASTFDDLYGEYRTHLLLSRDAEAVALMPDLIARMDSEAARQHAVEIAFWLMDRGDWPRAQAVLRQLEDAWWIQFVTSGIPVNVFHIPDTPRQLYARARTEAIAGRHEAAIHLLGMAYLFTQFMLIDASSQRQGELERTDANIQSMGPGARDTAPSVTALTRAMSYRSLGTIYDLLRDILGLYPRLQREAIAAGNADLARQYSGLGLVARMDLRDRYTLSGQTALTMETAATTTNLGEAGYTIYGRDLSTTETVTPLPGTQTPEELGTLPTYSASMEALLESIAGQEEFLTELFAYPEIQREFRGGLPDMNSLGDRLRVWRTMLRIYQRENLFPLAALMNLIRDYLQRFTFHSEYNIRDFGVSYLTSDFPADLAGRAARDCGVYALMTAYEVHHTARGASPRLNLDFRLYAMPEHVMLVISDRDEGNFYVVNNDQIRGPHRGDVLTEVASAYSQVFGRQFGVAPGLQLELGSTDAGDRAFRRQIWERYQVGSASGIPPERPPETEPDEPVTVEAATQQAYQRYYEDLRRFDTGTQSLGRRLAELRQTTFSAGDAAALAQFSQELPDLVALGRALTAIFMERGPQASIVVDEPRARRLLGRGYARQLPGIVGDRPIYLFTQAQGHPLAHLAMALLRYQSLGGTLSANAQQLIQDLHRITEFNADITQYDRAGRPAAF